MKVFLAGLLLITLQHSFAAVSPTSCDETEPVAEKVLDLINKWRKDGYLFQLVRVADAHVDQADSVAVYYLVLDIKEFDCPVLSRKHWTDCELVNAKRPSDIVIGQCKVIATSYVKESEVIRVNDFNCTTSSVSSALANTKDSPVLLDFLEDTESYRKYANKALENYKTEHGDFASFRVDKVERVARARGGERTNYHIDFSVRNCSSHWFPKHSKVFGFCRSDLSYDVEHSDLETPTQLAVHCEFFKYEEHRNFSGRKQFGHPFPSDEHEHPPAGRPPFNHCGPRDHHHRHKPHKFRCPLPLEDKDHPGGGPPPGSKCHHPIFGHNRTHGHSHDHNHNSSEHHSHGHHPHGHHLHGHHLHGHHPHGEHSHGHHPHGHHLHGHHPHGEHSHGHHPHGHHLHGHHPHGEHSHEHPHGQHSHEHHPHGHHPYGPDFHDLGPCDPPLHGPGPQYHHHPDVSPKHSKERGPGKRHSHSHWKQIGYVYRLPPLNEGEILPLPEANFPRCSCSFSNQNKPLRPEIQLFPQSASELCPGIFKNEFLHLSKFFENIPK